MMAVFKPFQLACQSKNSETISIAVDCLGKLFTYNFWGQYDLAGLSQELDGSGSKPIEKDISAALSNLAQEDSPDLVIEMEPEQLTGTYSMIAFVVDTICNGYISDEKVELQIVKALQAAVSISDPAYCLHGAVLIQAIKTTYNVFLVSNSISVQTVAQGALTQMVQYVVSRIPKGIQITLQKDAGETTLKKMEPPATISASLSSQVVDGTKSLPLDRPALPQKIADAAVEKNLKDAYLVLATLSKISIRPVSMPEG
jgi:brefeldin A-inhibited guanine nucleotide-exchange protein